MTRYHSEGQARRPFSVEEEAEADARNVKRATRQAKAVAEEYKHDRRKAYGDIGDELDMQYWDLVNGTTTFRDHIAAVKAAHSKP
jgi:hypothetical protein